MQLGLLETGRIAELCRGLLDSALGRLEEVPALAVAIEGGPPNVAKAIAAPPT